MTIAAYWAMRLIELPLPTPEFAMQALPGMLVLFFVTALVRRRRHPAPRGR